jgi:hypothetical protein
MPGGHHCGLWLIVRIKLETSFGIAVSPARPANSWPSSLLYIHGYLVKLLVQCVVYQIGSRWERRLNCQVRILGRLIPLRSHPRGVEERERLRLLCWSSHMTVARPVPLLALLRFFIR